MRKSFKLGLAGLALTGCGISGMPGRLAHDVNPLSDFRADGTSATRLVITGASSYRLQRGWTVERAVPALGARVVQIPSGMSVERARAELLRAGVTVEPLRRLVLISDNL